MLSECLEKLENAIDPEHAERSEERVRAALSNEPVDRLPLMVTCPVDDWPTFTYRETFEDPHKMLLNELAQIWMSARVGDTRAYTIRANYGVGAVASLFGCPISLTEDDAMPWVEHLDDEALDRVLDAGPVDVMASLGGRVLETERYYCDTLALYPKLSRWVHLFTSDTQGPFDTAHLVMGHKIYTEVYDNPERVHRLLELVTDAYLRFTRAQSEFVKDHAPGYHYHTQCIVRGGTRVCDDSSINLSADFYREFSRAYNEKAFAAMGGGWVHYCGGGHQILEEVLATEGITAVNFGNPERQDVARVLELARPAGAALISWPMNIPLPDGVATGVSLMHAAPDIESAKQLAASNG